MRLQNPSGILATVLAGSHDRFFSLYLIGVCLAAIFFVASYPFLAHVNGESGCVSWWVFIDAFEFKRSFLSPG